MPTPLPFLVIFHLVSPFPGQVPFQSMISAVGFAHELRQAGGESFNLPRMGQPPQVRPPGQPFFQK